MTYKHFKVDFTTTMEDIKAQYRKLALKYHPDRPDGDLALMVEVNGEYDELLKHHYNIHKNKDGQVYTDEKQYRPNPVDERFKDIIDALIRMGLDCELVGSWIWIHGDTKAHKDEVKQLGFRWSATRHMWYLPSTPFKKAHKMTYADFDTVRAMHGSTYFEGRAADEKPEAIAIA